MPPKEEEPNVEILKRLHELEREAGQVRRRLDKLERLTAVLGGEPTIARAFKRHLREE